MRPMPQPTSRTLGEMQLMKPTSEVEQIIVGIIGRAQRLYPLLTHSLTLVSTFRGRAGQ
jgi:hypothetical protein